MNTTSRCTASTAMAALFAFGFAARVLNAQTFSAQLVTTPAESKSPNPVGRIFVSGKRTRIEVSALADGFFVVDVEGPSVLFVKPGPRLFMNAKRSSETTQIFVPVDPAAACVRWAGMERAAGPAVNGDAPWQCERIDTEQMNGRATVKYEVGTNPARRSIRWVDVQRRFPVKVERADGTVVTLESIVDGPQSATLFDVPSNYRTFDPLQLIDRIKQSDVWVEPPPAKRPGGPQ